MNAMSRKRGPAKKSEILDTAVKLASRDGLQGLTIGLLAKAVGMSKSGLFAHFNSKVNLKQRVVERVAGDFTEKVLKPAFKESRGEPRVRGIVENWIRYLNDPQFLPYGDVLIAVSLEVDEQPGALRDLVKAVQRDLAKNLEKAARIAVEEGHFRADLDTEEFAWSLLSFVLGYHHFRRILDDPKAEDRLRRSFEGLVRYSKPPGGRSPPGSEPRAEA